MHFYCHLLILERMTGMNRKILDYRMTLRFGALILFLALSVGFSSLHAFNPNPRGEIHFQHISLEQGLSQGTIMCILQDSKGFLWFGTEDGLNRYDGYSFEIFRPDPENPNSLSSNAVRTIIEDSSGYLWIGTFGGGLNKFDWKTGRFTHYRADPANPKGLSNDTVLTVLEDRRGMLWIGTFGGGLNRFDPRTGTFTHFRADPGKSGSLSSDMVRFLYEDRAGLLWVGTFGGGLNRFDPQSGIFTHYRADAGDPAALSNDSVLAVLEDRRGMMWIGTFGGGLDRFDPGTGAFTHFRWNPDDPGSLSSNDVRGIYEDSSGNLWVGTFGGGLNLLDRETGRFTRYLSDPADPLSLSDSSVQAIYEDRSGALWFGTVVGGLNKFWREKQRFNHYRNIPGNENSLSSNKVMALCEDRSGILWIGTHGGLNRLDQETGGFSLYRHRPGDPAGLSSDEVTALLEDSAGVLWVGTMAGLNRFHRQTGKFSHYLANPAAPGSLSHNRVTSIEETRQGDIWIGTIYGLNRLDRERKSFKSFVNDPNDPNSLSYNLVVAVKEDRGGVLWAGTHGGLNKYDRESGTFTVYRADTGNPGSLSSDKVNYLHQDRSGTLWIGTYVGLNKYVAHSDSFIQYTTARGLPNNLIYGILEDDSGNLWISTNNGVSKFNPKTETFKNYDYRDGLQSNEFKFGACFNGKKGKMFFGGINGFNAFFPGDITDNLYLPPIVITKFSVFNKPVDVGETVDGQVLLAAPVTECKEIRLSYKHSVFSFEYSALHYGVPEKNRYAFKMDGLERQWNEVGNRRFATYSHLDPGSYVFRVKGTNNDGIWNEEGAAIAVIIDPPPWRTWWAYTLYFLALSGIMAGYVRTQRKKLAYERSVNERLRQVDRLKDEFLANTSHELRTPLNGIIGIAESLVQGATGQLPQPTIDNLQMVALSGKRLSSLVNDILDYSRLKEKDLQLQLRSVDIKSLTDVVLMFSKPLTAGKRLTLRNGISEAIPQVYADENRLQQIMHNLVGNAVKFTDTGSVSVDAVRDGDWVTVRITDTGIGIPEEKFGTIFASFEQVDGSTAREYGGTGLGLSISKRLVELHGGAIGVESQVGAGSTFWFTLPVWRTELQKADSTIRWDAEVSDSDEYAVLSAAALDILDKPEEQDGSPALTGAPQANTPGKKNLRGRILAVDDEVVNLQVLINHLSLHRYEVITAMGGKEAIKTILDRSGANERIDLVLLDVMMPRMTGYDVCRMIRNYFSAAEMPVIMLTAKNQMSNLLEGLNAGANDYITKPFSSEEMLERINVHLQLLEANRGLKSANRKLEDYNRTLEERVADRTRDLREKNRLITDSIHFAQHIQNSILPFEEKIKAALPEHFILFRPKDIVSGDFYWFEDIGDKAFIAAVDCTGHGVPGALMSMIGGMVLNKLVRDQGIDDPSVILGLLHKEVRQTLIRREMRHIEAAGMDVCLCKIEKGTAAGKEGKRKVTFAGAHLPLYVVKQNRDGENPWQLEEVKGDRKAIGGLRMEDDRSFSKRELFLEPGSLIYLTTDGYADQNNEKEKKFGKKRLKNFLLEIAPGTIDAQREMLTRELENHMENEEQRDDITVIGVKVS